MKESNHRNDSIKAAKRAGYVRLSNDTASKKHSNGLYTILEGSMYPVLYRLEEQGYISYYEQKAGKQQTRVYYHLEDPGREYWEEVHSSYEQTLSVINFLYESKEGDVFDHEENGNKKL